MTREFAKKDTAVAKGMAVLLLLFYHLFHEEQMLLEMQVDYRPISKEIFLMIAGFGNICVAVFVMITAYGITKSILNVPEMNFKTAYVQAWRRFWKLLTGFVILYVSVVLVWSSVFDLQSLYGKGKQGVILMLSDALGFAQMLVTPTCHLWKRAALLVFPPFTGCMVLLMVRPTPMRPVILSAIGLTPIITISTTLLFPRKQSASIIH